MGVWVASIKTTSKTWPLAATALRPGNRKVLLRASVFSETRHLSLGQRRLCRPHPKIARACHFLTGRLYHNERQMAKRSTHHSTALSVRGCPPQTGPACWSDVMTLGKIFGMLIFSSVAATGATLAGGISKNLADSKQVVNLKGDKV